MLTSLVYEDLAADGSALGVADLVVRRAELAHAAGAAGVITSPNEVTLLRHRFADSLIVTPGVRPRGAAAGDQKRVATAAEARAAGADQVVVGRPIRDAHDPLAATRALLAELV